MTNVESIHQQADLVARRLSYGGPKREGDAKFTLIELVDLMGKHYVRIHRKRDGFLMVSLRGTARFLTWRESLVWLLFRRPPQGYFTLPETPKVRLDLCGND